MDARASAICVIACVGLTACLSSSPPPTSARASKSEQSHWIEGDYFELTPPPRLLAKTAEPESRAMPATSQGRLAGRVTLQALLAHAERNAPSLQVARSQLARSRAEMEAARVVLPSDPEVSGSIGVRRAGGGNGIDYGIGLTQQVEVAGQRRQRRRAANALHHATQARVRQARWSLHQRVHALFHSALVARDRVGAADGLLKFSEAVLTVARQRLEAGETSPLPVRIAEGELAQARQKKLAADAAYLTTRLQLATAVGWRGKNPPDPAGSLVAPRPPPATDGLVDLAKAHHPELVATRAEVRAAQARVAVEDRSKWGAPSVGVSFDRESDPLGPDPESIWKATITIPLPLWQRNRPARARARADLDVANASAAAASTSLEARVRQAAVNVEAHGKRIAAYGREILPRFQENLDLLRTAFELGEIDMTGVLVARERFLQIQADALDAYDSYYAAVAELEAVVGTEIRRFHQEHDGPNRSEGGRP